MKAYAFWGKPKFFVVLIFLVTEQHGKHKTGNFVLILSRGVGV